MPLLELLTDFVLVFLLAVTIGYCRALDRRVRVLQDGGSELAKLLGKFDASTRRASESIAALQAASRKAGDTIHAHMDRANFVAEDLSILVDQAEKLADRLEAGLNINRSARKIQQEQAETTASPGKPQATQKASKSETAKGSQEKADGEPSATVGALQTMLEKIAERSAEDASRSSKGARSRVEQELLEIIRAGKE